VSASDNAVVLRNYEGMLFRYAPEDKPDSESAGYPTLGVSSLLSGTRTALVPDGTPRFQRRSEHTETQQVESPDVIQLSGYQADGTPPAEHDGWSRTRAK